MYFLTPICLICLREKINLHDMNNQLSRKLLFCTAKTAEFITDISNLMKICTECSNKLNAAVQFKRMCLNNMYLLKNYAGELSICNNYDAYNIMKVHVTDMKQIEVKQESSDTNDDSEINESTDTSLEQSSEESKSSLYKGEMVADICKVEICENADSQCIENIEIEEQRSDVTEELFLHKEQVKEEAAGSSFELCNNDKNLKHFQLASQDYSNAEKRETNEQYAEASYSYGENLISDNTFTADIKVEMPEDPNNPSNTCYMCNKSFKYNRYLKKHISTHDTDRPFCCTICGKSFRRKDNLKTHMLTHADERQFSCNICSKTFKYKCNMKMHLLTHTDELQHFCTYCGKSFRFKSNLTMHMLIHTNQEVTLSCTTCGKGFKHKGRLYRHMVLHAKKNAAKMI